MPCNNPEGLSQRELHPDARLRQALVRKGRTFRWAVTKPWLFRLYRGDERLPSYMGIVISHCKDPGLNNQYYGVDRCRTLIQGEIQVKPGWYIYIYGLGWWQLKYCFHFYPDPWGNDPIWLIFSNGLKPPTRGESSEPVDIRVFPEKWWGGFSFKSPHPKKWWSLFR